jgi:ParB-like chromosome segregation protein Spo0J
MKSDKVSITVRPARRDPLDDIVWLPADELTANDYNPNVVFNPELKLLERSMLTLGWVQPIMISRDNVIIDGFHRWMLARTSKALIERYGKLVPCAVLDVDRATAMVLTVRMNRAKGSHVAVDMAKLVKQLVQTHGLPEAVVAEELGATPDEIRLLLQDNVFKAKDTAHYKYSRAWYPKESRHDKPQEGAGDTGKV